MFQECALSRGSQYCASEHRRLLAKAGLVASISRQGDCRYYAMAESLVMTIKVELGDHFSSRRRAEQEALATTSAKMLPSQ